MLAWIKECATDLDRTFMAWGLDVGYKRDDLQNALIRIKSGNLVPGDAGTEQTVDYWNEFVQEQFISAIRRDIYRFALMGDKTITAAKLTKGADDVKNYNAVDGAFKQVINAGAENRAYEIEANQTADQELPAGESYPRGTQVQEQGHHHLPGRHRQHGGRSHQAWHHGHGNRGDGRGCVPGQSTSADWRGQRRHRQHEGGPASRLGGYGCR